MKTRDHTDSESLRDSANAEGKRKAKKSKAKEIYISVKTISDIFSKENCNSHL